MWMQVPIKNKIILAWGWGLALVLLLTAAALGASKPKSEPTLPQVGEPEIAFSGKVFSSLKRKVDLPFKGVITAVKVKSGQKVEAGEILATYRLTPEASLAVRQRMFPPQISETEVRLAETERTLTSLNSKQREIAALSQKKLAPEQSRTQIDREVKLVNQERQALRERLQRDREIARQDLAILREQLGEGLKAGQIPQEAALVAPMSGYVLRVSPELQEGAELPATPGVIQLGVMDPMLVQAQAFEIEALQIKPGQVAEVTLESLPGKRFEARVSSIAWSSLTPGLDQPSYYEVEMQVPNPDLLLKEGLKARIVFRKSPKEGN